MCTWIAGGFGWWWLAPMFMILFFGLIVWAVVALVRGVNRCGGLGRHS